MKASRNITTGILVGICILAASSAIAAEGGKADSWPTFRGSMTRTGTLDSVAGPNTPAEAIWSITDTETAIGDVSPSPAVVDGKVYLAGSFTSVFFRGGNVYCIDVQNGKILWRFKTAQQVFSSPAVVGGRVYCGEGYHTDGNSKLYCLDAKSGDEIWSFQTKSHLESSPAVADGHVFFGAGDDGVYCVTAEKGEQVWHFENVHVDVAPAVADGHVFFGAGDDGVYCVTADKGEQVWHFENVHVDVAPAVDEKHVYFGTGYGTFGMYCVNRKTGEKVWNVESPHGAWGTPSVVGDDLYYAIGNGTFYESAPESERTGRVICCDRNTGKERWHYDVGDGVLSAIAIVGDRAYFGCRDKNVYCLNRKTGKEIWKYETGGPVVSSPAVDGEMVYIGSDDGSLYAFEAKDGKFKWFYDIRDVAGEEAKIWSSPALAAGRLYFGSTQSYIFCLGAPKGEPAP